MLHMMALALLPSPRLPPCAPIWHPTLNVWATVFPNLHSRVSIVMEEGRGGRGRQGRGGRGGGRARSRGRGGRGRPTSSPTPKPDVGDKVSVVEKANYGTDLRTAGVVSRVLTRAAQHPRGFKVMLQNGVVGRCTDLIERGAGLPSARPKSDDPDSSDAYLDSIWEDLQPQYIRTPMREPERSGPESSDAYLDSIGEGSAPQPRGMRAGNSDGRGGRPSLCLRDSRRSTLAALFANLICIPVPWKAHAGPPMMKTKYTEDAAFVAWGPLKGLSDDEIDALEALSMRSDAGVALSSGTRVIDLVVGTGPEPKRGDRVYCSYKVWGKGFRAGPVSDWTYLDARPYDWVLGEPTDRMPPAFDEGIAGMREGGWRRLVVPRGYGDAGLRKINPLKGGGRYTPPKAGFAIQPNTIAYVDLIMVDGGSGRSALTYALTPALTPALISALTSSWTPRGANPTSLPVYTLCFVD